MPALHAIWLVVAGAMAGLVGSAGGITSLISYPALLAVGIPRLPASVTNSVALVTIWPGSAVSSRQELAGWGGWVRAWSPVVAIAGAGGAALLLVTPPGTFARVVPGLIAFASVGLLLQPWIAALPRSDRSNRIIVGVGLFLVSIYAGYFGAGTGVMVLTLLLCTVTADLPKANALKNTILGVADLVAAAGFVVFGPVRWLPALYLGLGLLIGSMLGPRVTRRVPATPLRIVVALAGIGLAIDLWVT
jgi:uncharacterized protein